MISFAPVGPLPIRFEGILHSSFKTKSLDSRENDEGMGGSLFVIRLNNIKCCDKLNYLYEIVLQQKDT